MDMTHYEGEDGLVLGDEGVDNVRHLHVGDNLEVMRGMGSETVDLVYLDPPFNSNQNYRIVFRGPEGLKPRAYLPAFEDVWVWDDASEELLGDLMRGRSDQAISKAVSGMLMLIGRDRMMAYLVNMTLRLIEIHRLLKATGSVYLHCDPTASHYLKVLMDALFGRENFRNEIIWCYRGGGVPRRDFARKHDLILRFTKGDEYVFNPQYTEYSQASVDLVARRGGVSIDDRERDLERGAHMNDWWSDINSLQTWSPERTGYPTQKPVRLLERIILSSTNEGDLVLDPFCGCGTTMVAAERLRRSWVGIDVEPMALSVLRGRFDREDLGWEFDVWGLPSVDPFDGDVWSMMAIADPERFERAVISLIEGCVPWRNRQDEGKGIEGVVTLPIGHVIVGVRGGNGIAIDDVRDFLRVVESESDHGVIGGVLVCGFEPTVDLLEAAAQAGTVCVEGESYSRLSVVTPREVLRNDGENGWELVNAERLNRLGVS